MADGNIFKPYKVINQTGSSLQLKAGVNTKIIRAAFILGPVILLGIGIALFITQKEPLMLYALGGAGLLELFIFSFIKIPAGVQLDRMGFTIEKVSIGKTQSADYLWTDVEYIRQRIIRNGKSNPLNYQAILKSGKKVTFLAFPSYYTKRNSIEAINAVLHQISSKEVSENKMA